MDAETGWAARRASRGQASVEYMVIFIIFIAGVSIVAVASFRQSQNTVLDDRDIQAGQLADQVSDRLNTAVLEGSGFAFNMTLPPDVGEPYAIQISSGDLVLSTNSSSHYRRLFTTNITGTLKTGLNTVTNAGGGLQIA